MNNYTNLWASLNSQIDKNFFPYKFVDFDKNKAKITAYSPLDYVGYTLSIEENCPKVILQIQPKNQFIFTQLLKIKETIEDELSVNIEWVKSKSNTPAQIKLFSQNLEYFNNQEQEIVNFLIENLYKFYVFFETRIKLIQIEYSKISDIENEKLFGKITKIELHNYRQFQNLELDLTYPTGHPKEGKPLEKVCFIGQSGTGKTTLLNLIQLITQQDEESDLFSDSVNSISVQCYINETVTLKKSIDKGQKDISILENNLTKKEIEFLFDSWYNNTNIKLINFPSDTLKHLENLKNKERLKSDIEKFIETNKTSLPDTLKKQLDLIIKKEEEKFISSSKQSIAIPKNKIIDFSYVDSTKIWNNIKKEINDYNKILNEKRFTHSKQIEESFENVERINEINIEFAKWKNSNPSPLKSLADNCLNRFLNKFNIKLRTDVEHIQIVESNYLQLETIQGKPIHTHVLSSGTKQLLLRAVPLYYLKPTNSILLFDEPEDAFYPDVQEKIVEFYSNLGVGCQCFFATHSPVIASCFEPWEIIELKFDEDYNVIQEKYYHGDRVIDNFHKNPQLLRWDSLYMEMFGMNNEGNPKREEELNKLADIDIKIQNHKKNGIHTEAKEKLLADYQKIAKNLNWKVE